MEREVLFWVFISFFVLIGIASLVVQFNVVKSDPAFRKWARVSFVGAVVSTIVALFKMDLAPVPVAPATPEVSYSIALVMPSVTPPLSLQEGSWEYDEIQGDVRHTRSAPILPTLAPGGWVVKLPAAAADKGVRLKFKGSDGQMWGVRDPFYPNYIAKNVVTVSTSNPVPATGRLHPLETLGVVVVLSAEPRPESQLQSSGPPLRFDNWTRPFGNESTAQQYYEWRLFVNEPPAVLASIKQVDYILHPSFPNPFRTSRDRDKQFELVTSGWGTFTVQITVFYVDGRQTKTSYALDFMKKWPANPAQTTSAQAVDWSKSWLSSNIDYQTWNGDHWSAVLAPDGRSFVHYPEGRPTERHTSANIDYKAWDGKDWSATISGGTGFIQTLRGSPSQTHADTMLLYTHWYGGHFATKLDGHAFRHAGPFK